MTKPKNIYTITVMEDVDLFTNKVSSPSRTMGWYPSLKRAKETLHNNTGNLHECLYMFAVIEKTQEGVFPICDERWWYGWKKNAWVAIDEPKEVYNIVNFGIG